MYFSGHSARGAWPSWTSSRGGKDRSWWRLLGFETVHYKEMLRLPVTEGIAYRKEDSERSIIEEHFFLCIMAQFTALERKQRCISNHRLMGTEGEEAANAGSAGDLGRGRGHGVLLWGSLLPLPSPWLAWEGPVEVSRAGARHGGRSWVPLGSSGTWERTWEHGHWPSLLCRGWRAVGALCMLRQRMDEWICKACLSPSFAYAEIEVQIREIIFPRSHSRWGAAWRNGWEPPLTSS